MKEGQSGRTTANDTDSWRLGRRRRGGGGGRGGRRGCRRSGGGHLFLVYSVPFFVGVFGICGEERYVLNLADSDLGYCVNGTAPSIFSFGFSY